jgi:hypothetical protein
VSVDGALAELHHVAGQGARLIREHVRDRDDDDDDDGDDMMMMMMMMMMITTIMMMMMTMILP